MEKKRKPIQIYAILVNIVAIIAFLIAITAAVSAIIDRGNPLYAGYANVDLSSFEKYKMDLLKTTSKDAVHNPSDDEITRMYEAAKEAKINQVLHRTWRDLVVSLLTIIVSAILFGTHWWLMKKHGD